MAEERQMSQEIEVEIEAKALMIEFEALKVEAKGQEMADLLAIADFTSEVIDRRGKQYLDVADRMREVAAVLKRLL